jgi:hypothetical protein
MKIVINNTYGGFSVSEKVYSELGLEYDGYGYLRNEDFNINSENSYEFRTDKKLISAIEKIGVKKSSGECAELKIIEIPDGIEWMIDEYDGMESVHEKHRTWG